MAPEYLVRGQLTEKADVYSFGVLVIEVISGKRNSAYTQEASSLLHLVTFVFLDIDMVQKLDYEVSGLSGHEELVKFDAPSIFKRVAAIPIMTSLDCL